MSPENDPPLETDPELTPIVIHQTPRRRSVLPSFARFKRKRAEQAGGEKSPERVPPTQPEPEVLSDAWFESLLHGLEMATAAVEQNVD